jgi:hypothetical protein
MQTTHKKCAELHTNKSNRKKILQNQKLIPLRFTSFGFPRIFKVKRTILPLKINTK